MYICVYIYIYICNLKANMILEDFNGCVICNYWDTIWYFACISQVIIMVLYPVSTYIFKKDCVKLEANPRNSHKNNYWDSGGKVYDESWKVELLGLEKTGIKYQVFEGEKNQLFSILQKSKQDLSWAQACPAAREECVSAQGALDWQTDYVQGWVMQGESPWRGVIGFSHTAPTSILLNVMLPFRASQVSAIQQAFHAVHDPASPLFPTHVLSTRLSTFVLLAP